MTVRSLLGAGGVIPAHPLALTRGRRLDERRQRALTRYYLDAGVAGIAIGVHTTQFMIRKAGLYQPVLALGIDTIRAAARRTVAIAGVIGPTVPALREARTAKDLGYDAALVSLGGLATWSDRQLLDHAREVAQTIPLMGFYLQPAVGGRHLSYGFWRRFVDIQNVVAIKVAPFNRYQTIDVLRAVAESGRAGEIALYTGNDDAIVADLTTSHRFPTATVRFVGGLLGHWAFWTKRAVELVRRCRSLGRSPIPRSLATLGAETTDANAAVFDAANGFRGCLPGISEILRRQGLLGGRWCLDPAESLSPGQARAIARVCSAYPHLTDDDFVRDRLDRWLTP